MLRVKNTLIVFNLKVDAYIKVRRFVKDMCDQHLLMSYHGSFKMTIYYERFQKELYGENYLLGKPIIIPSWGIITVLYGDLTSTGDHKTFDYAMLMHVPLNAFLCYDMF